MSNETEAGTQTHDCSSDTIDLGAQQTPEINSQENESTCKITFMWVDKRVKQAIDPILRRVEELCVLLVCRVDLESTGNNKVIAWRRHNTSTSPSDNRHDSEF